VVKGPAKSGHGLYEGVCSNYLDERKSGDIMYAFIQNVSGPFHLPQDVQTPIIMVAAGTGLAPFRGFLQERSAQKKSSMQPGPASLFFGCRHPQADFLYKDELEGYAHEGIVKLYPAFSRLDPQKKTFVQDILLEHKDDVWQMLQAGAIVYVCGDADTMVPGVQQCFMKLAQEKNKMSEQQATAWLNDMVAKNRYIVDIWGVSAS
jgi:cytochrome P450/NADPH-cytochrome P450 reductase